MKLYLSTILFFIISLSIAQNEQLFEQANGLYNQEKYSEAINLYQRILDSQNHSASLYFNKANAHYKLNEVAESIYNYEKALQLEPNNEDILNNLNFAKNMRIDKIDVIPTTGFSKLFNSFVNTFNFDTWAIVSIIFIILFVLLFLFYIKTLYVNKKRLYFTLCIISFLFALFSLGLSYKQESNSKNTIYAIVFAKESEVKSEPKLNSEDSFILHAGTKVKVIDTFENWTKIKIANGSIGWLLSADIKKL